MLLRPLLVRRGSSAIAILAIVVASTAATAMLTLFTDVQAKLRALRGSDNIIVTANASDSLPPDALQKVESQLGTSGNAAPFGYLIARVGDQSVVVAGIDVEAHEESRSVLACECMAGAGHRIARRASFKTVWKG